MPRRQFGDARAHEIDVPAQRVHLLVVRERNAHHVDAVLDAIEAFTAAGNDVVVHCHGGRSRTGLVLKAWYMRHNGATHREAHAWLHSIWPLYQTYNRTFWDFLENDWTAEVFGETEAK
mgnify:CR=1 FL=1